MEELKLKYVGQVRTPNGLEPMWDTGKIASAAELAESRGLQSAIANARDHRDRKEAKKRVAVWIHGFARRMGLYAPGAFFGLAEDGRLLVDCPAVQLVPPEAWPDDDGSKAMDKVQTWSPGFRRRLE